MYSTWFILDMDAILKKEPTKYKVVRSTTKEKDSENEGSSRGKCNYKFNL